MTGFPSDAAHKSPVADPPGTGRTSKMASSTVAAGSTLHVHTSSLSVQSNSVPLSGVALTVASLTAS